MNNTPSLEPCPFCGAPAHGYAIAPHSHSPAVLRIIPELPDHPGSYVIEGQCPCGSGLIGAKESEVTTRWNRRTPQPVNLGFTIENRAGIDVLVREDGGCQPATNAEVAMWKALAAVQQPVVREPLTDDQLWANDEIMSLNADLGWHMDTIRMFTRAIERAHGITRRGGSNVPSA